MEKKKDENKMEMNKVRDKFFFSFNFDCVGVLIVLLYARITISRTSDV